MVVYREIKAADDSALAEEGGRKSIAFNELKEENFLPRKNGIFVPYLDMIAKDLSKS